ncbi:DUF2768 family protein [Cohnella abietis]|uniref:DUF2768 domain-containing protein n=1 Tax=Cohnella abietis TaxID=2507935 RepID=A0A3T1D5E2_9BACL|nr:DUF2768 family protein [Cohnella abietis]BBI33185.1 hypothetical protein KCTCHS21_25840 [Cohnella abietis]
MYIMLQTFIAAKLDPMSKMWVSFIGMGLMVISAAIIYYARAKTKGWIRLVLTLVAFVVLIYGLLCGLLSII